MFLVSLLGYIISLWGNVAHANKVALQAAS